MQTVPRPVTRTALLFTQAVFASSCFAQAYPSKPILVISGANLGTHGDVAFRSAQPLMSQALGQPIVIDVRLGAGGQIAATAVKNAPPDGYTLYLTASASLMNAPHFVRNVPYDSLKEFTPIAKVSYSPSIIAVNAEVPVSTVPELIAYAKKHPGKLAFGSTGVGTAFHLLGEQLNIQWGVQMLHVPYKGIGIAVNDLVTNRIQVFFPSLTTITPALKTGKVRLLATVSPARLKAAPDLPAIGEVTPEHRQLPTWFGLIGPAGLPEPIVARLNHEANAALRNPAVVARMEATGAIPGGGTAAEFADEYRRGYEHIGEIVKALGIKPE
jgi:tripartite-type tricarboxylate transporter receptor subunit TctC